MKRKLMRPIDIVNRKIHKESSTGGVPAGFLGNYSAARQTALKASPVAKSANGKWRIK